jgi:hypothetical protein
MALPMCLFVHHAALKLLCLESVILHECGLGHWWGKHQNLARGWKKPALLLSSLETS